MLTFLKTIVLLLPYLALGAYIYRQDSEPKIIKPHKKMHVDMSSLPPEGEDNWIIIRSLEGYKYFVRTYGAPTHVHFGSNLGSGNRLGIDIAHELMYQDCFNDGEFLPSNFQLSTTSTHRLKNNRFYVNLKGYLLKRIKHTDIGVDKKTLDSLNLL